MSGGRRLATSSVLAEVGVLLLIGSGGLIALLLGRPTATATVNGSPERDHAPLVFEPLQARPDEIADDGGGGGGHYSRGAYQRGGKFVAFSLYGDRPMDLAGAVFNAQSIPLYYLTWRALFIVDDSVPAASLDEIRAAGGVVRRLPSAPYARWGEARRIFRYLALNDTAVDYVMFRDTDSRVSAREIAAVHAWLRSNKSYHVMRDHPAHTTAMLGGMWGVYAPTLRRQLGGDVAASIAAFVAVRLPNPSKFDDQAWLTEAVWPRIGDDVVDHDAFLCGQYSALSRPFPLARDYHADYVGHILDPAMDEISTSHVTALWPEYRRSGQANFHEQAPERCRPQPEAVYG